MKIGLSLSMCVRDICNGVVQERDVVVIISSTRCNNDRDWSKLYEQYLTSYWRGHADASYDVLWRLREAGKIIQPRCDDPDHTHQSSPYWLDVPHTGYVGAHVDDRTRAFDVVG